MANPLIANGLSIRWTGMQRASEHCSAVASVQIPCSVQTSRSTPTCSRRSSDDPENIDLGGLHYRCEDRLVLAGKPCAT